MGYLPLNLTIIIFHVDNTTTRQGYKFHSVPANGPFQYKNRDKTATFCPVNPADRKSADSAERRMRRRNQRDLEQGEQKRRANILIRNGRRGIMQRGVSRREGEDEEETEE
uniref:Uncharacterized protein n=1 Tax=Salix viminalis TaxID=40686 RepID=A0A6N2N7H0_SALVM